MRNFTTLFITLFFIVLSNRVFAFEYEGLNFTVISSGDKTVSVNAINQDLAGDIVIPEKVVDGGTEYTVTEVASSGFRLCQKITSLVMPNTITKIGKDAFSVCASMKSVVLSEKLEVIDNFGFNACTELKTVALPAALNTIGNQAFSNCLKLESFTVDAENKYFTADEGVLFSKDKTQLIYYPNARSAEYEIPSSVNTIAENAFYGCKEVTKITVGENVTTVGEGAFYMCSLLEEMILPNSVTTLNDWAFAYCASLKSVVLPENITFIGNDLFAGCGMLEGIVIPEKVQSIGNQAFHSCRSLAEVKWNSNITVVGSEAFSGCKALKVIEISSPVTEIGLEAFYGCSELKKLVLPAELESVYDAIILDCAKLDTVVCYAVNPPACSQWTFEGLPANCKLYVPSGTSDDYSKAYGWDKFTNVFEMEGSAIKENVSETVKVYAFDGKLAVDGVTQSAVVVYGLDGRKVIEFTAKPGNNVFELNSGLYLVSCGGKVVKVIL